jgi:hypothetical protein
VRFVRFLCSPALAGGGRATGAATVPGVFALAEPVEIVLAVGALADSYPSRGDRSILAAESDTFLFVSILVSLPASFQAGFLAGLSAM